MSTRRQVIRWIAAVAGTVVGLLPRFRQEVVAQEEQEEKEEELEFEKIAAVADLKDKQLLLEEGFSGGPVLLIQEDPEDVETLVALNPTCTHRGCTVAYQDGELACPCHGARYDLQGKVTKGPAKENLAVYQVKVEEDEILLAVSED